MKLLYSFPDLNNQMLDQQIQVLDQMFGFKDLPQDYKDFLLKANGGFVSPGIIDLSDSQLDYKQVCFDTILEKAADSSDVISPSLYSFSAVWLNELMDKDKVENWDLFELTSSNNYLHAYLNIMPDNMLSIASCNGRNHDDMICLSLDPQEFGSVYYYYNNVNGPQKFSGDYHQKALQELYDTYHITKDTFLSSNTPEHEAIFNALKKTYFVKVAPSFTEFLKQCYTKETTV
ncbi:SMI1/KNR4 family protein [Myroides sp. LJL119]